MDKRFHGKVYYTHIKRFETLDYAIDWLKHDDALKDEKFYITVSKEVSGYYIYSDAKLESFRGDKYHSWEKFKQIIYRRERSYGD